MKKNRKWIAVLPFVAVLGLVALLWITGNGYMARTWANMQEGMMTFARGLEQTGTDYGVMSAGPGLNLRAGTYRLDYELETDGTGMIRLVSDNAVSIYPSEVPVTPQSGSGSVVFTVYNETDNFQILIDYQSGSFFRVKQLSLTGREPTDNVMTATLVLLAGLVLYALYLRRKLNREELSMVLLVGFAAMMASAPCFKSNLNLGDDMLFHLERLGNLTNGLLSGQFPVRVGGYMNRGYGAGTSVYYPELFLYIPAVMILLGTSIQYAMQVFLVGINLLTALTMFQCARKIFEKNEAGVVASVLYTLAVYRLTDVYTRSALGEALAMAFLPLLVWGLWEVIRGDKGRWPLLALSAAAIFQSHMISTLICAVTALVVCLLCAVRIVKERRVGAVFKAGICCLLLCLFSLVPLATYNMQGVSADMMLRWNAANAIAPSQLLLTTFGGLSDELWDGTLKPQAIEIGIPLLLAALAAVWQALRAPQRTGKERFSLFCVVMGAGFALMTTTLFPWALVDTILGTFSGYLQFPWRLLMMTTLFFALAGGYAFVQIAENQKACALFGVLALCLVVSMPMLSTETRKNRFVYYGRVSEQNLAYMDYTLEGTDLSATLDSSVHTTEGVEVSAFQRAGTSATAQVSAQQEGAVSFPFFGFDGYAAEVDGQKMDVELGDNNRLKVLLPAGTQGTLKVWFAGKGVWRIADAVSALTLLALVVRSGLRRRKRLSGKPEAAYRG